jgi:hypothetical protein
MTMMPTLITMTTMPPTSADDGVSMSSSAETDASPFARGHSLVGSIVIALLLLQPFNACLPFARPVLRVRVFTRPRE